MRLAGIDDVWSHTRGQTQTTVNFARATFDALKQLSKVKASEKDLKTLVFAVPSKVMADVRSSKGRISRRPKGHS